MIVCRNRAASCARSTTCAATAARALCDAGPGHADRFFKCPYHAWAYDLDGNCLGTPLFTPDSEVPEDQRGIFDMSDVKAFDKADYGLHRVRCERLGLLVFVCLDAAAPPLRDELGDLPRAARRVPHGRVDARSARRRTRSTRTGSSSPRTSWSTTTCPGCIRRSSRSRRWTPTTAGRARGKYVGVCTTPIAADTEDGGWLGLPAIDGL